VLGLSGVNRIAGGRTHTCAILEGGGVACWGSNWAGELGDGTQVRSLSPKLVAGVTGVTELFAAESDTCALHSTGGISCWGWHAARNNGLGTDYQLTPLRVAGIEDAVGIGG
jgi:alpha-tubulin suppressor-like RCC1 family protein